MLQTGYAKLNTTRVSERAGASVGTTYQYFLNKDGLLPAVIGHYIGAIGSQVRDACELQLGQTLQAMVDTLVGALVEAKTRQIDVSLALHAPMTALHSERLVVMELAKTSATVQSMLAICKNRSFRDLQTSTDILLSALTGAFQAQMARLSGNSETIANIER